jgi:hypothetical protein
MLRQFNASGSEEEICVDEPWKNLPWRAAFVARLAGATAPIFVNSV